MQTETIHKALEREYDRERKRRKTKKAKEKPEFVHIDLEESEMRDDSPSWLSDHGAGVEAIVDAIDGETPETLYEKRRIRARDRLRKRHPDWVDVYDLVVENRTNRKDSICAMMLDRALAGWLQENGIGGH